MEQNPDPAKGAGSNPTAFWNMVALELNSLGPAVKEGTAWKRTWIEKKSVVKKKLSYNKKELQKTGGGKAKFDTLSGLEERIAAITNMRDMSAIFDKNMCMGIGQCFSDKGHEIDQSGTSHSKPIETLESSHQNQTTDQPGPSHISQTTEYPGSSHHSHTSDQPSPSQPIDTIEHLETQQIMDTIEQPGHSHHSKNMNQPQPSEKTTTKKIE
uniref:Regulatory protein zeste n=1 Tax=Anopheles epiroticus TaxID=199890 RepID=A0A182PX77_9DIPT